jgi:hypothetical protein
VDSAKALGRFCDELFDGGLMADVSLDEERAAQVASVDTLLESSSLLALKASKGDVTPTRRKLVHYRRTNPGRPPDDQRRFAWKFVFHAVMFAACAAQPFNDITTVGIDVAKRVFAVHAVAWDGRLLLRRTVSRGTLLETIARLPAA